MTLEKKDSQGRADADLGCLLVILVAFTGIIFYMTAVRYMSFLDLNWDLGINMQMLWSTLHGKFLFETADFQMFGAVTFLQANSVYIAIPFVYLYGCFPNPFTLLIVQSIVLSAAILPIFFFTALRTGNSKIALLVSIAFISGFAVLSSVFYDFHWEAFIPLEFFTFVYFFTKKRYGLSIISLILGCLTLQVYPFMVGSFLLFKMVDQFSIPKISTGIRRNGPNWRISLLFLVAAGVLAYAVGFLSGYIIPTVLGIPSSASGASVGAITYLFNFGASRYTIFNSLEYWLLLFAALSFIPLLKPKALIVVAPWFYWSVIAHPVYTSQFGVQYGLIAVPLITISFIEGLRVMTEREKRGEKSSSVVLMLGPLSLIVLAFAYETTAVFINHEHLVVLTIVLTVLALLSFVFYKLGLLDITSLSKRTTDKARNKLIYYLLLFVILVGLIIGPLNPANTTAPFTGGYAVSFKPSSSYQYMSEVSSIVGHSDTVLSTDNLFPFVANNVNAYSLYWFPSNYTSNQYFPYQPTNLPQFLLLAESEMFTVPHYILSAALNPDIYGLRIEITNSQYPGDIFLYQAGYTGPVQIYNT